MEDIKEVKELKKVKEVKEIVKEPVQDFSIPKGMDIADYVAQEIAKERKSIEDKQKKSDMNKIAIGLTVMAKDAVEGGEKKDKNKNIMTDENGQVMRYPTKYYIEFAFMGGLIKTEVTPINYQNLHPTMKYFCKGYLGPVTDFGKTTIQPIFFEFEPLS